MRQWEFIPKEVAEDYLAACREVTSNAKMFENFRKHTGYGRNILEGGSRVVGEMNLLRLDKVGAFLWLKKNLEAFRDNDKIGNPTLFEFTGVGHMSPATLQYANNSWDILKLTSEKTIVKIVEIGGGYGGLCRILSCIINFESYIIIDEPDALAVAKKYISYFPEVAHRVQFISCYDTVAIEALQEIDLAIACASIAELSYETQSFYNQHILLKAKNFYVVYNSLHIPAARKSLRNLSKTWRGRFEIDTEIPWSEILHIYGNADLGQSFFPNIHFFAGYLSPFSEFTGYYSPIQMLVRKGKTNLKRLKRLVNKISSST